MTATRLLIINTADAEKAVRKIIKKHSRYYENKDAQIKDYDVHSQTGQVLRLTYTSGDIENELSEIDETQLICLTTDDNGGYRYFGKLKHNSFNANISAYAGLVVAKNKKIDKKLRDLAAKDDRIEIIRFFEAAVKDWYSDEISYQVNPFVNDARFLDIMSGIDLISAELEKGFDSFNYCAIWYSEHDGRGNGGYRGDGSGALPILGVTAHIVYTKSDGTSWLASSENNKIKKWPAPPASTAEGGRF